MMRTRLPLLLSVMLSAASPVAAEQVVVYRCVDPSGGVTLQNNAPCPAGSGQQILRFDRVDEPPAPAADTGLPTPPALPSLVVVQPPGPDPPAQQDLVERSAPPALYRCRIYTNELYFREDAAPPPRCRPMRTTGIGGLGGGLGTGAACERVEDECIQMAGERLCEAWRTHVRETEFRWRFAAGQEAAGLEKEYHRLAAILQTSTCSD